MNAVVTPQDLDAEVQRWCDEMLALSPTVLKILKHSFDEEYARLRDHQTDIDYVATIKPDFFVSGEQQEGAAAFLEKRPPDFARFR